MFRRYNVFVNEDVEDPMALRPVALRGDRLPEMKSRQEWEQVIAAARGDYITPLLRKFTT